MEDEKEECLGEKLKKNWIVTLICTLLLGILLGWLITYFANNNIAVYVNGQNISTKHLYNKMKEYYPIDLVLEDVDKAILQNKYQLTEDEMDEVKEQADYFINMYSKYYGYADEEEFLEKNNFKDKEEFINYLSIDYRKNIYFYEYLETLLDKDAVENYYNENSFGTINTKHILVKTNTEFVTNENALAIANEIITRLDGGEDFDMIADEYVEKYPDYVITEDLGDQTAFSHLESGYIEAMKTLNKGEYTKEPAQTSYG